MQTMTSRWTDERMDDLKQGVDELGRRMDAGFAGIRQELREHRRDMDARFDKVDEKFDKVDEKFEGVDGKFQGIDEKFEGKFERVDEKFEKVGEQLARTQEMVIGLHATLTRFSLAFLVVALGAVVARLA